MKKFYLLSLLLLSLSIVSFEDAMRDQALNDIELATRLGSGEIVTINLNATEGLEGIIAQNVKAASREASKSVTFTDRLKSFFNYLIPIF